MSNFIKNKNGMNIVGQGGKILLFMLPALIGAISANIFLPDIAAFPAIAKIVRPAGPLLLVPGLVLWGTGVLQLMMGFPKGKLVTTGAYGVVRNPIYCSAALFILPAISLLTGTWVYFVPATFLFIGVMIFIGKKEEQLGAVFGGEYEDYKKRVGRMIPLKRVVNSINN